MGAGLAVIAWGVGRLDIMAITPDGDVVHTYYDQNAWRLPTGTASPTPATWA